MPRKPNASFVKPLLPSPELAAIVGSKPIPRTQAIKKMWAYIKENGYQSKTDGRNILAKGKLAPLFAGEVDKKGNPLPEITMFKMTAIVSANLTEE